MELILIDKNKLKIMLTAPDMQHYALDTSRLEGMACTDTHTREVFRHIFHDAEAETGFHTEGEKLLVQMYTSKCGGCEIFVTKLESPSRRSADVIPPGESLSPGESALIRRALTCQDKSHTSPSIEEESAVQHLPSNETDPAVPARRKCLRDIVVTVADLDTLLALCRRLLSIGYERHSRAYIEKIQTPPTYHLCLEVPDGIFYTLDEKHAFLKEYGEVSCGRHASLLLTEYGQVLCGQDAVSVLGHL